ncbi:hypothetical protein GCM10010303_05590 [Streptomyces purpurascens]|nr:hypothetical protein GCM10010303_05590 [Streptomyces purpurascens]
MPVVVARARHLGYTIPPQADAGWIGAAGLVPSYLDAGGQGLFRPMTLPAEHAGPSALMPRPTACGTAWSWSWSFGVRGGRRGHGRGCILCGGQAGEGGARRVLQSEVSDPARSVPGRRAGRLAAGAGSIISGPARGSRRCRSTGS